MSRKVFIVEDDVDTREMLGRFLELEGYEVETAANGKLALERLGEGAGPCVIVLDLMMPEVNGFDVVEALKEHPDTARIPILVVTAKQITIEDRAKLSRYVTTIMEKAEFDPDRFTAEVRRAMSGRRLVR